MFYYTLKCESFSGHFLPGSPSTLYVYSTTLSQLLACHVEVPLCVRADPAAVLPAGGRHHQHPPVPHEALPPAQRQAQWKLDFTLNFHDEVLYTI